MWNTLPSSIPLAQQYLLFFQQPTSQYVSHNNMFVFPPLNQNDRRSTGNAQQMNQNKTNTWCSTTGSQNHAKNIYKGYVIVPLVHGQWLDLILTSTTRERLQAAPDSTDPRQRTGYAILLYFHTEIRRKHSKRTEGTTRNHCQHQVENRRYFALKKCSQEASGRFRRTKGKI